MSHITEWLCIRRRRTALPVSCPVSVCGPDSVWNFVKNPTDVCLSGFCLSRFCPVSGFSKKLCPLSVCPAGQVCRRLVRSTILIFMLRFEIYGGFTMFSLQVQNLNWEIYFSIFFTLRSREYYRAVIFFTESNVSQPLARVNGSMTDLSLTVN